MRSGFKAIPSLISHGRWHLREEGVSENLISEPFNLVVNLSLFFREYEMKEITVHSRHLSGFIYEVNATQEGSVHRDHVISPSQSLRTSGFRQHLTHRNLILSCNKHVASMLHVPSTGDKRGDRI